MEAHVPHLRAVAVGACWSVTEHVDHVVETSREHVHTAELVPDRLENLQMEISSEKNGRIEASSVRAENPCLGEDGSIVVFREAKVGQTSEPAAPDVGQLQPGTRSTPDL